MILTALLWIVLVAAVLLLAAIASPLRFGGSLSYKKSDGGVDYGYWITCIHPLVCRIEYSSEGGHRHRVILGFEKISGGDGGDDEALFDDAEGVYDDAFGLYGDDDGDDGTVNTDNCTPQNSGANAGQSGTDDPNPPITGANLGQSGTDDYSPPSPAAGGGHDGTDSKSLGADDDCKDHSEKRTGLFQRLIDKISAVKNSIRTKLKGYAGRVTGNSYYKALSDAPLRRKLTRWLRRLWRAIFKTLSFENLSLHARVGLSDPALLGRAYGYFIAAREAMEVRSLSADLAMEPVFTEECLEINARAEGKTTLSLLIWHLLAAAATFPYLRLHRVTKAKDQTADSATSSSPEPAG